MTFDGPVATLTLQHGSMNAIDDALLDELAATFALMEAHSEVSVLRIRSERRVLTFTLSPDASKAKQALTR